MSVKLSQFLAQAAAADLMMPKLQAGIEAHLRAAGAVKVGDLASDEQVWEMSNADLADLELRLLAEFPELAAGMPGRGKS